MLLLVNRSPRNKPVAISTLPIKRTDEVTRGCSERTYNVTSQVAQNDKPAQATTKSSILMPSNNPGSGLEIVFSVLLMRNLMPFVRILLGALSVLRG